MAGSTGDTGKRKSDAIGEVKELAGDVAIEIAVDAVIETAWQAAAGAMDVATNVAGAALECGSAIVEGGCALGGKIVEGVADL
ncbi:hypothetical protein SAMN06295912_12451 [Sphingomonas laterariae]|uniref:Uncharacterized protein n=1 Tax=Edaphosphingomonas laterariae TaxID=861865 RepID=A0A239IHJ0_9SPHN|nr:hypothetical protein [Sphingomonas laterariae]SNS93077.1 hypothetical protein SAMN06295912_12451 [Sphingomonas laterariae]